MLDSAESSTGRVVLQGNFCSAGAKLDGGPTSGAERDADEDGGSPGEATEAGGETRCNGISLRAGLPTARPTGAAVYPPDR